MNFTPGVFLFSLYTFPASKKDYFYRFQLVLVNKAGAIVPSEEFRVTTRTTPWSSVPAYYLHFLQEGKPRLVEHFLLFRPVFAFLHCYISQRPVHARLVFHPDRLINHPDCKRVLLRNLRDVERMHHGRRICRRHMRCRVWCLLSVSTI